MAQHLRSHLCVSRGLELSQLFLGYSQRDVRFEMLAVFAALFEGLVQTRMNLNAQRIQFLLPEASFSQQAFGIKLQNRWMLADFFIQQRLGITGLVSFIVAVAPVTKDVDDNVF